MTALSTKSAAGVCNVHTFRFVIPNQSLSHLSRNKGNVSNDTHFISAFADDTGFIIEDSNSTSKILSTFDLYGKASGSRMNRDKTEGLLLGRLKNTTNPPINIKWVESTKSLGVFFCHFTQKSE